jgi:hypothetical protein
MRHLWWNTVTRQINNYWRLRQVRREWIAEGRDPAFSRGCGWVSLETVEWAEGCADEIQAERNRK